jgi:hypothetical protein
MARGYLLSARPIHRTFPRRDYKYATPSERECSSAIVAGFERTVSGSLSTSPNGSLQGA